MKRYCFPISILIFLILEGLLIFAKISPYENKISSLIGIWEGFAEINPYLVDPGFVVFRSGGYDGQFFYFLAKSMFTDTNWDLILDSYFFRLHRIGMSFFLGILSHLFGFVNYPFIAILTLTFLFLFSVWALYRLLPEDKKILSLFYLFSPFTMNSNLLLVADGLFTSFLVIGIYFHFRKKPSYLISAFFLLLAVFTRELGAIALISLAAYHITNKNYRLSLYFLFPLAAFLCFLAWTRTISPNHLGTNPLGFTDMVDLPLFGFVKSFYDEGVFHLSGKEAVKLILFLQFFAVSLYCTHLTYKKVRNSSSLVSLIKDQEWILILPILASLGVILFAEQGYWRSFDNLSRMFTMILPLFLLLHSLKQNLFSRFFLGSGILLFLFLILRITWITSGKEYYLSP
ncbi:glycosyltransferase family 39 protein [Leptospira idonii]|uniref:glycosyltransferase family 39 protein n=1 Tax=Leptospira idonii TaxID=1193500 RepID=UPI001FE3749B|nr:glycosyltransferase family 39 protein [Leptospira idonii]